MKDPTLSQSFSFIGPSHLYLRSIRRPVMKATLAEPDWRFKEIFLALKVLFRIHSEKRKDVSDLESLLCKTLGSKFCICTSSGRVAILASLIALGVEKGDGVILPSFACLSILEAVLRAGGKPQFVDVDENLNMEPESVKKAINKKTKVVVVPHLFGKSANILEILKIAKDRGLFLIDDAAQSFGVRVNSRSLGTFGDAGILSFGPFKPVGGIGGGAILTDNFEIFKKVRDLCKPRKVSESGCIKPLKILLKTRFRRYFFPLIMAFKTINFSKERERTHFAENDFVIKKMSGIEARFVMDQIPRFGDSFRKRRSVGRKLFEKFSLLQCIKPAFVCAEEHGFLKFVVKVNIKDQMLVEKLLSFFIKRGVEAEPVYVPLHLQMSLSIELPNTEFVYSKLLALPVNHTMGEKEVMYVFKIAKEFEAKYGDQHNNARL